MIIGGHRSTATIARGVYEMPRTPTHATDASTADQRERATSFLAHLEDACHAADLPHWNGLALVRDVVSSIENGLSHTALRIVGKEDPMRQDRVTDESLALLLPALSNVELFTQLDLSYNQVTDNGAQALAHLLSEDKFMESVSLKSNSIQGDGASQLAHSLTLNHTLKELDLSYNCIGKTGGMEIASVLQINTTLKSLNLSGCSLTLDPLIALATVLRNNTAISILDVSDNASPTFSATQSLQSSFTSHWAGTLRVNSTLRELRFGKMGLTDWVLVDEFAAALGANKGLRTLDLSGNKITRDGASKLFVELKQQSHLKHLCLSNCKIQDQGAQECATTLKTNTALKTIYLENNGITAIGLRALAEACHYNTHLQHLRLWGNLWDSEACEAFNSLLIQQFTKKASKHPKPRFSEQDLDVSFYQVGGIMHVAHRDPK
ncbi:hypothetical protein SeMB42_g02905 [Synchytrium endobioticum]|uniref:Uncharacterized protein n=1 Tax=Synchytrium endobioticum TaxID=286115 RepID=A0A507DBB8_9FUNG|nr:hypothetical protein SeLEV6574_g06122 [Synchytrium endobioticum]TPX48667.1 hypothetical protein SeMB42_g02905 [Synchytrium endobioticum]